MDRQRLSAALEKLKIGMGRYKYAIAAVLMGAALLLLPSGGRQSARDAPEKEGVRNDVQGEMEALLSDFDGVGALRLMLSVEPGTDRWAGAVIVCEGAGSAAVRLELTRAVNALTGLSSDRISIVKGRPDP